MDEWTQEDAFELAERETRGYQKQIDALTAKSKTDQQRINRFALMILELADEDDMRLIVVEAREYLEGGMR